MSWFESFSQITPIEGSFRWMAPSNIAFVKYWGKKGPQLPANPSLSMTLKKCHTKTQVQFSPNVKLHVDLKLDGVIREDFANKVKFFLESLTSELPFIGGLRFNIETINTFPHSTGIASSASGLAAFALCLTDYLSSYSPFKDQQSFYQFASNLSRLASGSASRSVFGGFVSWGDESDEYSSHLQVHPSLLGLMDSVLVVSSKEKKISSRSGHQRMNDHYFAQSRFIQAKHNFSMMKEALISGDLIKIGELLEAEALALHAMMMTSPEAFWLLSPESLILMDKVRDFRRQYQLPLYFTLDAGPNLHLIYPNNERIKFFIESELAPFTETIIHDQMGEGPQRW